MTNCRLTGLAVDAGGGFAASAVSGGWNRSARFHACAKAHSGSEPTADAPSTSPAQQAPAGDDAGDPNRVFEYEGPLAVTVRRVKILSLSSLAVTLAGSPILVQLSSESMPFAAKAGITGMLVGFGFFTTALLQWFVSPYVLNMRIQGGTVTVDVLNVLARRQTRTFRVDEVTEPQTARPLATFAAGGKIYYLDGGIASEELLSQLGLRKQPPPQQDEKKKEDDDDD